MLPLEWERNLWSWFIDDGVSLAPDTQSCYEIKALPTKNAALCLDMEVSKALKTLLETGCGGEKMESPPAAHEGVTLSTLSFHDHACWATTEYITTPTWRDSQKRLILIQKQ